MNLTTKRFRTCVQRNHHNVTGVINDVAMNTINATDCTHVREGVVSVGKTEAKACTLPARFCSWRPGVNRASVGGYATREK